jgi:hypothetical protein
MRRLTLISLPQGTLMLNVMFHSGHQSPLQETLMGD